jgi:hypothetical protein
VSPRREPPPVPLLVLLLPALLERMPDRSAVETLLAAPGALAVEPPRVSYRALARLPGGGFSVARRQAHRMRLPGVPAVVAMMDPLQFPLAAALLAHHPGAELWYAPPADPGDAALHAVASERAAARLELPLSAPLWARMESLGVESGRLGSERLRS